MVSLSLCLTVSLCISLILSTSATKSFQDQNPPPVGGSLKGSVSSMSSQISTEESKTRKLTANLENLDQELRKLHSQGNPLRRDSTAPIPSSQPQTVSTTPQTSVAPAVTQGVVEGVVTTVPQPVVPIPSPVIKSPVRRLSRFQVSAVVDDPLRGKFIVC